jgi:hypothetical protein
MIDISFQERAPITTDSDPAEEVLVRGAQEPKKEQSAVLLRVAEESGDEAGELLRAVSGKELQA